MTYFALVLLIEDKQWHLFIILERYMLYQIHDNSNDDDQEQRFVETRSEYK